MRALIVLCAALSSACFAVTDLGRFEEAAPNDPNFSSLRMSIRGFTSHPKERFEYRIIDNSNVIQSRGLIIPLGDTAGSFQIHSAVPKQNGPFHVDFFSDHNSSGEYESPPRPDTFVDHSWRLPLTDNLLDGTGGTYVILFDHNTSFTDLNTPSPSTEFGQPVTVHLANLGSLQNHRIEVRVADASSRRVTAMFRVPVVTTPQVDAVVKGMVEPGVTYSVEVYTDDNKSPPGDIKAFRFQSMANETGLTASFDGNSPPPLVADAETAPPMPPPL